MARGNRDPPPPRGLWTPALGGPRFEAIADRNLQNPSILGSKREREIERIFEKTRKFYREIDEKIYLHRERCEFGNGERNASGNRSPWETLRRTMRRVMRESKR